LSFRSGAARPPEGRTAIKLPRWPRYLLPVLGGLVAFVVVLVIIAGVWTDFLWYRSVHYGSVFGVTYGTRWALFFIGGIFMALVTGLNAVIAFRLRPAYRPVASQRPGVETYRLAVDPHRRLLLGIVLALVGLISGLSASGAWRTWLLFVNQVPFGQKDPQFRLDISFFVFTYPFIRLVLGYLFAVVLLSLAVAVAVHALYGGLRLQGRRVRATTGAQTQLFILVGAFVLLKGVAYWFDRYGIDFSQRGTVTTGASYTDVNAVLPAKTVLAVIAILCAILFFAGAVRRSALLPAVGFGLLVLSAILVGGVYPAIIQQFVVKPNELAKETPYIKREINSTRSAYAVNGARVIPYPGVPPVPPNQLANQVAGLHGLRLMDPAVLPRTFEQLQQVKGFYQFPSQLSVDRYQLPGGGQLPQDLVVAVRGMGGPPQGQGNWINTHLVYTHGFGFVAAKANAVGSGGDPAFVESDIPPHGQLGPFEPRVYFGQQENPYAIVGGPPGQRGGQELDYPVENASGQVNYTYTGNGGVPVGSPVNRLLYAIKFRELNILLSGAINSYSKILYDRQPLARVAKVAPFLTLDGNPYPVVANNRILWVVDGYTTTDLYPYSERISMPQATSTSQDPNGAVAGQLTGDINYLRNSVKAVVDAYTGAVTLYQWGPSDPLLRAWMNAFPNVIKPKREIPGYLLPHLRYPQDEFEVQRQILAKYHVENPQSFYGGQNFWTVPNDPTGTGSAGSLNQPPYYLTMTMPGYHQPAFSLTTTLAQKARPNLAAYMAVESNPQSGYGVIRILQLPQAAAILGPEQVQNAFESFTTASKELSLFRQGGSSVIPGNLIALPLGGGLLYEEPIYIQAAGGASTGSYPTLRRVFVYFDGQVGYSTSLQGALAQVFTGLPSAGQGVPSGTGAGASALVRRYLQQAEQDYATAQAALRSGNLSGYAQAITQMKQALDNAQQAAGKGSGAASGSSPSAAPTPAHTASASPSPSP
jgi:uncharacterized membrane protein (UPF0182 family)